MIHLDKSTAKLFRDLIIYHAMFISFFRICEKEYVSDLFMQNKKASFY